MFGPARLSPKTRGVADIDARAAALERYEAWTRPVRVEFSDLVGEELWAQHWANHAELLQQMRDAEKTVELIRERVRAGMEGLLEPVLTGEPAEGDAD